MPRIPIRVEPYSSPAKQHRHYKCKRDQVLRALGKAAYINGSQFAILLVSARGDVETYASDALQDHLDDWFMKSGVAEEARQLTLENVPERRNAPPAPLTTDDLLDDVPEPLSGAATPSVPRVSDDPFLESWSALAGNSEKISSSEDWSRLLKRSELTEEPQQMGEGNPMNGPQVSMVPQMSTPLRPVRPRAPSAGRVAANAHQPQHIIVLRNEAERTAFIETRLGQLQQVMCKMIAKEWIKVIEPKKQTRFPYNKGEEGKPGWWPKDVRHKEPDHLMKPERHALLLAMLRSSQARIARLQLATAEVVVQIKSGRVSLLMDIYRVAREEEKLRDQNMDINTPITVGVSTLDGWDGDTVASESSAAADTSAASTSQTKEDSVTSEPISKLLGSQRKRRRLTAASEETPERSNTSMSWTPISDPYEQHTSIRGISHVSPSNPLPSGVPIRPVSSLDVQRGQPMQPSFDASDLSSYSPIHAGPPRGELPPATPGSGPVLSGSQHGTMAQSPVTANPSMVNYPAGEQDLQRNTAQGIPPTQKVGQPMKPTRSAPAHMPNSPEPWQVMQSQGASQGLRIEPFVPSPMSMTPHGDNDQRMTWPVGYPGSPMYPPHPQQPPQWAMPETPLHRPPLPGVNVNVGPNDVRFSPSFDASFSNSGPMTPGSMSMHMHPIHAHMQPPSGSSMAYQAPHGKSPAIIGGDLPSVGAPHPNEVPAFDVKLEPKPNVRYSGMSEWPCQ